MHTVFRDVKSQNVVSTAPTAEPVEVSDLASHVRYDATDEAALLASYIKAARELVEADTRRSLMSQTRKLYLDWFPPEIELHYPPVSAVSSIAYTDENGDAQTLAASKYRVDTTSEPARIHPAYSLSWPSTRYESNAITVTYTAGYASAALVPEAAKQAIRMLAAHWFVNRETLVVGTISKEIEFSYNALIDRLRWGGMF